MDNEYLTAAEAARESQWWPHDMPVKDKIIHLLAFGKWVCGTTFLSHMIPTYSQRCGDLIGEGWLIEREPCTEHKHRGNIRAYRLKNRTRLF